MVSSHLSDIFFSLDMDFEDIKTVGRSGQFSSSDKDKLTGKARWLLDALHYLGVINLPTPEELVDDFYSRL